MNLLGFLVFAAIATALLTVRRRWAPLPLILGCCYLTHGQGIELGAISLPALRLLLVVGILRVIIRGERIAGGMNQMDWLMLALGLWLMFASLFHEGEDVDFLYSAGVVLNIWLVYYLFRTFCRTTDELAELIKMVAIVLVPVALEMLYEKVSGRNLFSALFGGVSEDVVMRNDRLRARGPFRQAILAGTVAATCFPLMVGIRQRAPRIARMGMVTTLFMVIASASSGPVMTLLVGIGAVLFWRFRQWARYLPWALVGGYALLAIVMNRPVYYIISRIDLAGGSTGWHRSRLIDAAITHLDEWWLFGTDVTRHWMPTGITFSSQHTDITNYYLGFGVMGGLLAVVLVLAMIWYAYKWVLDASQARDDLLTREDRYLIWCLGSGMFAHAVTGISVAYYDQSYVFFWFNLAVISSFHAVLARARARVRRARTVPENVSLPPRDILPRAAI